MEYLREIFTWVMVLVPASLIYLVPGWALLEYLWPSPGRLRWPEKLGISAGLSLAAYPVVFLMADLIGVRPGIWTALGPVLIGAAGLAWKYRRIRPGGIKESLVSWAAGDSLLPDLTLAVLIFVVVATRVVAVHGLVAPMWGDSYQHSLITRLLVENGGLFESWEPYAPLRSFTYHFGFHAQAAALEWVTTLDTPQAVLSSGQLLNVIAVIGLVPLATRTGRNRWAGAIAVLVAGLLAPMPMFYTNWGRYTQLAGQAILPAAVLISWSVLDSERTDWKAIGLGWIALGGLALTHYRVLLIAVAFFLAYMLVRLWRPGRLGVIARLAALGAGSLLIFLPWLTRVLAGPLTNLVSSQLSTPPASESAWHLYNSLELSTLDDFLHPALWLLMLASVMLGLVWRKRDYILISLWWLTIVVATNPNWIMLPGVGLMSNFAIAIAAYIPAAVLIGAAGGELLERAIRQPPGTQGKPDQADERLGRAPGFRRQAPAAALILLLGLLGGRARLGDLDPGAFALVTAGDRAAMDWIRENIPPGSRFHVNQFFAFSDSVTVGSDGGWWLPLLAGRGTDLPPINYSFEQGPRPDYTDWILELPRLISRAGIADRAVIESFKERGITHIYLGEKEGRVNHSGELAIDPADLTASPFFKLLYHEGNVWIFEVVG